MVRTDPLSYLSEQLEAWRKAGTYQRLRVLESACEPVATFDGKEVKWEPKWNVALPSMAEGPLVGKAD